MKWTRIILSSGLYCDIENKMKVVRLPKIAVKVATCDKNSVEATRASSTGTSKKYVHDFRYATDVLTLTSAHASPVISHRTDKTKSRTSGSLAMCDKTYRCLSSEERTGVT